MDGVDFYVYGHLPIHIGGVTVYITTTHICLAIVMAALIIFAIVANHKIKKADPSFHQPQLLYSAFTLSYRVSSSCRYSVSTMGLLRSLPTIMVPVRENVCSKRSSSVC